MLRRLNKYTYVAVVAVLVAAVGVTMAATNHSTDTASVTVPESSAIHVRLNSAVTSDRNRPGDHFEATVSRPVVVDGKTVIPEGAQATGMVVDARPSGRLKGRAHLLLALEHVNVNGNSYQIHTDSHVRVGGKHKKQNLVLIGGGAGGGMLIGAIAAGGKGALIGGPVGAGAGAAAALIVGKKDIHLRAETPLTFTLAQPVTIPVKS